MVARGVQKIFSEVSRRYELVNHIITLGLDTIWRRRAANLAVADGGGRWMDVCSGTGEMALYLSRRARNGEMVVSADFSSVMMAEALAKPEASHISFVLADVRAMPFNDDTFDLITISFGTRNINLSRETLTGCFSEFHRVLRRGGRFVNLETSQPPSGLARRLFHMYIRLVVKSLGRFVSGSKAGYAYLAHTIPRFYAADELADIMRQAGFAEVDYSRMVFGAVALHRAVK
ncbi:ubiquinone/menaquinone biosynthesis methyltransferase [Chloroflexota bacterium]